MIPKSVDVLVVGGGPAGLSCAARLGRNLDVLVVHQDREIGKPVRTSGGSWLSEVEVLGIPSDFYQRVEVADLYADTQQTRLDLSPDPVCILDVTRLYQWLAKQVHCPILCAAKFLRARRAEDGVACTIRHEGSEHVVTASYVIDATGWHMAVLDSLGLAAKPARRGIGIEYEYPLREANGRAALFFGAAVPTGYGWAFPTNQQSLRLGVGVIEPDTDRSPKELMEQFLASGALERMGFASPEGEHVNAGILPSVKFERQLVYDRVIRVGDSANMATPVLGEGIRHAIAQGRALGWALRAQIKGDQRALQRWERQAIRRFWLTYALGFAINKRAAGYGAADWDASVARLSRLSPEEVVAFLKNDFPPRMVAKRLAQSAWRRIARG